MAKKTQERKDALRKTLIDIAEAKIKDNGLASIKARDLSKEAGCALGAIYNIFPDLRALIMEVNGRTFKRLGAAVSERVENHKDASPRDQLIEMSYAYLEFARENYPAWKTLFDLDLRDDETVPAWYRDVLGGLFAQIEAPLTILTPDLDDKNRALFVRGLFSSIHGIVLLSLENRLSGVPESDVKIMIFNMLNRI